MPKTRFEKSSFPEILRLEKLIREHQILVHPIKGLLLARREDIKGVSVQIGSKTFQLYVDDEYDDLDEKNQVLALCLVLRELEQYDDAEDFLVWCNYKNLSPDSVKARNHHMELGQTFRDIEAILGNIDSQISDLDFELNSGAAQWIRLNGFK
jgi:hypothetical protein